MKPYIQLCSVWVVLRKFEMVRNRGHFFFVNLFLKFDLFFSFVVKKLFLFLYLVQPNVTYLIRNRILFCVCC